MSVRGIRPTTKLFAVYCEQYRAAATPHDRWDRAAEARDFYAVCIAKDAIEGLDPYAEHAYAFRLFARLHALHNLRYCREGAARQVEPAGAI